MFGEKKGNKWRNAMKVILILLVICLLVSCKPAPYKKPDHYNARIIDYSKDKGNCEDLIKDMSVYHGDNK